MPIILHIADAEAWNQALREGEYKADTLATQGFMHCSTPAQVVGVANFLFRGRRGLVLLHIDSERVRHPIKYELASEDYPPFPHIYGPLNLDAVVHVEPFEPNSDGCFALPDLQGGE